MDHLIFFNFKFIMHLTFESSLFCMAYYDIRIIITNFASHYYENKRDHCEKSFYIKKALETSIKYFRVLFYKIFIKILIYKNWVDLIRRISSIR